MSRLLAWLGASVALSLLPLAASCSAPTSTIDPFPIQNDPRLKDSGSGSTSSGSSGDPDDGGTTVLPDGGPKIGRVYGHSPDTLYLFEPYSRKLTTIGKFSCVAGTGLDVVIDIAVDRTGAMFGTTFEHFLSIDPTNAQCTKIVKVPAGGAFPNSLSFVPGGTVDPTKEALVGYAGDALSRNVNYVRIDTQTGAMTTIGNLNSSNPPRQYKSSGDFVSLIGDKTYLTARLIDTPEAGAPVGDLLIEVNPKTGAFIREIGDTKTPEIFGFGYWGGRGYGFSNNGSLIEIDMGTGAAQVVTTLAAAGGTGGFYGAGSTTSAPTTR
ncbi:MAG: hypothetical protein KC657_19350 [Myxococcales bacterium]|nr:hypothetical protein [Myxococcales bacterium]